jgi:lysine-specific demethylase 8
MGIDSRFQPVPESSLIDGRPAHDAGHPFVARGAASQWPAVRAWTFERLAAAVPDLPVQLVEGNREAGPTRFRRSTLRQYLLSLESSSTSAKPQPYLKEFDLLKAAPGLGGDLHHHKLLPPRAMSNLRSWIGPATVSTGLHYDYLANIAVQILGAKRWRLVRAGAVERLGAVSAKYDSWAVLASSSASDLAARADAGNDFFTVDLLPGDVLYVPPRWWHEVTNLTPSLMFGGFHGPAAQVLARWAWVCARDLRHRIVGGECTCHPA